MKQKPEAAMVSEWSCLFNKMRGQVAHGKVENPFCPGMPDYTYCIDGVCGWIEFKVSPKLVKGTNIPRLSHWTPKQRLWMKERSRCKTVFLALRIMYDGVPYDLLHGTKTMFNIERKHYRGEEKEQAPLWVSRPELNPITRKFDIVSCVGLKEILKGEYK